MADDFAGKAVVLVTLGVCRWNMPGYRSVCRRQIDLRGLVTGVIMSWVGKDGQRVDKTIRSAKVGVVVSLATNLWETARKE